MIIIFKIISQILFAPHFLSFLLSSQNTKEKIRLDLIQNGNIKLKNNSFYSQLTYLLCTNKYFRTLFYFRLNNTFAKILRIFYPKEHYFIIDVNTEIEGGIHLAHPFSTILNADKIGRNVYVNHLVTVGEKNGKRPIIGNNVQLHAGCIVIGGVNIGDNVIIGAGTVVVKDVPENSVVVGNPGKIINNV